MSGNLEEKRMNETKYTKEDLKTMQAWDLERKIRVTQTRIIEWYKHWNGKVSVSFSGGKDSTVLLDLARRIYPDIEAVFVDTGLEYPEIREFVKSKDNVTWLKPEMSFRKVIETYGYPVGGKDTAQSIELGRKALAIIMQSKWTMVTEHIWNTVGKKMTLWKMIMTNHLKFVGFVLNAIENGIKSMIIPNYSEETKNDR